MQIKEIVKHLNRIKKNYSTDLTRKEIVALNSAIEFIKPDFTYSRVDEFDIEFVDTYDYNSLMERVRRWVSDVLCDVSIESSEKNISRVINELDLDDFRDIEQDDYRSAGRIIADIVKELKW